MSGKRPPSKYVVMETLAERYHWRWEDIKQIPKEEMEILLRIIGIKNRLDKAEQAKLKRK